jgi:hypothetical protein
MGDDLAKARARKDLEIQLKAEAAEARRRADLTEARRLGVKGYLQDYRGRDGKANVFEAAMGLLSHYGFRGDIERARQDRSHHHRRAKEPRQGDVLLRAQGLLGKRANRALQGDVVKELHGEAAGDATAKALAARSTRCSKISASASTPPAAPSARSRISGCRTRMTG